jgi:hypothetical protein
MDDTTINRNLDQIDREFVILKTKFLQPLRREVDALKSTAAHLEEFAQRTGENIVALDTRQQQIETALSQILAKLEELEKANAEPPASKQSKPAPKGSK